MLKLKDIKKNYYVGDMTVEALKGINLCFRKNEFVSILGPSGCGKTTMLNIIGGLDKYTSGDLVINGVSTKNYTDRDWDVYRNHRIGFIFQSYNLIPHQTVLQNVELALTISGVGKNERIERAKKALDRVGLSGQYNKRPNQMSGGQCQRVAIARALVNEPEILLADEPTGALDTVTSVQIMELIKEISKERLVIMVTHNPDLAYKYSTRIVKCLDGTVQEDSNPFTEEEEERELEELKKQEEKEEEKQQEKGKKKAREKAKMSFFTAFRLSARNLYSKFRRTLMVAFAGCIGIVGVSTVLAVSSGVSGYISDMENDMLAGYPVYITTSTLDYSSLMGGSLSSSSSSSVNPSNSTDNVYINSLVETLYKMNGVTSTNKITEKYMNFLSNMPEDTCALVKYLYGDKIAPNLYTDFKTSDGKTHQMSIAAIQKTYESVLESVEEFSQYASMINSVDVMEELPSSADYIATQYDVVYIEDGYTLEDVINDQSSLIAVASKSSNTLDDLQLAQYGYFNQEQFLNYCYKVGESELYVDSSLLQLPESISYETLAAKTFTWYPNDTVYTKGTATTLGEKYYASAYSDGSLENYTGDVDSNYVRSAYGDVEGSVKLNVKCVLKLKSDKSYGCLSAGGLYYTNALSSHMRSYNYDSDICQDARSAGSLYNIEMGYLFRFDGTSETSVDTSYLSSSSSVMSLIAQFMGASSGSASQVYSYSASALGAAEYPSTVYFYCNDFEQKDKLTEYLDKWNDSDDYNLYKVEDNGFYTGYETLEDGTQNLVYYYRDPDTEKYYKVNVSVDGYATDKDGNQYMLSQDEYGNEGFYLREEDKLGQAFALDGKIAISDSYSINAYTLVSALFYGSEFLSTNVYYDRLEVKPDTGDMIYQYEDDGGNMHYVTKATNESYYKVTLDADGNVVSAKNSYKKYRYDESTDTFYYDTYTEVPLVSTYTKTSTAVAAEDVPSLYSDATCYQHANVVKNPSFTFNSTTYTLDTKGFYVDLTDFQNLSAEDMLSLFTISADGSISLNDYSKFQFYYLDQTDTAVKYYSVVIDEDGYLIPNDVSAYTSLLSGMDLSSYLGEKYQINDDGTVQTIQAAYSDDPCTVAQLIQQEILGVELADTSVLTKDDSLKIKYTDTIGLVMTMVNTLIQIITYALVAFTGLSLVVSTVMIAIITYVSVVERIKEIGVIRALGGRKKDVSHLFNAETFIIGTAAGVIGIGITYLLSLLINVIIGHFAGVYTIASLPWYEALIMIALSIFLTLIAGLIPAKSAANKDPVIALRTE